MTIFTSITVTAVCSTILALAAILQRNKIVADKEKKRNELDKELSAAEQALTQAVDNQPDNVVEHSRLRAIVLRLHDQLDRLD